MTENVKRLYQMTDGVESITAAACYMLVTKILEKHRTIGFNYENDEDMQQVRIANAAINVLYNLDCLDHIGLFHEVNRLIIFSEEKLRRVR
jgi:hypothetical protein